MASGFWLLMHHGFAAFWICSYISLSLFFWIMSLFVPGMIYYHLCSSILISLRCPLMNQPLIGKLKGHWFLAKGFLKITRLSIPGLYDHQPPSFLVLTVILYMILLAWTRCPVLNVSTSTFFVFQLFLLLLTISHVFQWIEDHCEGVILIISSWISW